jgi:hypothetical protein
MEAIGLDDEFVPPEFVPQAVPAAVQKVRDIVFDNPPVTGLRLRQIMQLLHATELEEYVLAADPRITYLPFDDAYLGSVGDWLPALLPALIVALDAEDEAELFGDTEQEPNKTFHDLWKTHDQLAYKLGGLMLAVADCTERART